MVLAFQSRLLLIRKILPAFASACIHSTTLRAASSFHSKSDWDPQVVKILQVAPHPNASALDIATVLCDYPVIIKRNEYRIGDLASYLPIDTVVPDNELFHFITPRASLKSEEAGETKTELVDTAKFPVGSVPEKHRIIKAKKIRGIYSQGLLIPCPEGLKEKDSVVEIYDLKKWEEEEEENFSKDRKKQTLRPGNSDTESPPSDWKIPAYDIASVRRYMEAIDEREEIILSEKIHGSNGAFVYDDTRLWVKSRNHYKRKNVNDFWWDVAIRYDLENILKKYERKVFFGEVYGHVKGFKYDTFETKGMTLSKVRFFDIYDLDKRRFLDFDERCRIVVDCGLECPPVLYRGPWAGKEKMYRFGEGRSRLGNKHVMEGWVLNTAKERYVPELGRMQLKYVSEAYNLQK